MMRFSPSPDQLPSSPALNALRAKGAASFAAHGLPTRHDEDWRLTSLKDLKDAEFVSTLASPILPSHDELKNIVAKTKDSFYRFVFINGILDRTASDFDSLPKSVTWSTEAEGLLTNDEKFEDAFAALNAAQAGQGLSLKIAANAVLEKPIRIHFETTNATAAIGSSPRLLVEIAAGAKATVIESYSTSGAAFTNVTSQYLVGEKANLESIRVQEDHGSSFHFGQTKFVPSADSRVLSLVFSTGARLSRHRLDLPISFPNIDARVLGALAGNQNQHFDQLTSIDHLVGGSNTVQNYKTLLDGESRSVFTGRIRIRPQAQKANSEQTNKNLILSERAEADSRPQLMIEADDVKAAHGSTVGQMSEEELFYLMSRGLSRTKAIPMLSAGFLSEIINQVESMEVKDWLSAKLKDKLQSLDLGAV